MRHGRAASSGARLLLALRGRAVRLVVAGRQVARRLRRRLAGAPAAAGNPRVEAAVAFDRAHARHGRARLPVLDDAAPGWRRDQGVSREQVIAVDLVVGTVNGGPAEFDRAWRPVDERARPRFTSVFAGMYRGEPLGRVEVYAWRGDYYVLDGHHRVAAARALGQDYLEAVVTQVSEHEHAVRP